ncbi:hypothetical protein EKO04_008533 [Ascochyta lentis]|uniref:DUF7918 domain-containing protein n=1 Tax=Ascochyta lentis TaxID=205686 RepID=A0A8H7MG57_9PLEO|nr:hypothetical protein EKO04_008533 [Ascochyta lentis]
MAVLPSQPGIEVSVVCNGAPLHEYDDDEDAPIDTVVTKYVEAVSGAEFGVRWTITQPWPKFSLLFYAYVDRKLVNDAFATQEHFKEPSCSTTIKGADSMVNGQRFLHKFCFAALTVDDNRASHAIGNLVQDIKGMGEITVKAYLVKDIRSVPTVDYSPTNINKIGKIPEKALKGRTLSHQTSLQAPEPQAPRTICEFDYVDRKRRPLATYTFKYRSRDALKSLLLIPRSPSPVPLEDRDIDTLSPEELRELVLRQRDRDAAARAFKQEAGVKRERTCERSSTLAGDDDDDEPSVVSTKRRRENYRTTITESGVEEIDLT